MGQKLGRFAVLGALVMSIYGCAARVEAPPATEASPPPAPSAEQALHDRVLVLDAHADVEIPGAATRYAAADGTSRVSPDKMRAGGMNAVVLAVAEGPGGRDPESVATARKRADQELLAVHALAANPANQAVLATSAAAVRRAHEDGKLALILGFQNARIVGKDVDALRGFFERGVRVFALTHMGHNDFADSSRPVYIGARKAYEPEAEHGGLSKLGRRAVLRLNEMGAVIDVSQLSRDATKQAVELSAAPVIASHSNVQALTNVRRNLSDAEIDLIARKGGVIHMAAFRGYLFDSNDEQLDARIRAARRTAGLPEAYDYPYELYWELDGMEAQRSYVTAISELLGPGDVEDMLDHIDYVVGRVGIDHVGIGNDFNHGGGIAGFEDASGALSVTAALLRRGYNQSDIEKIWGGNFLRVMGEAERTARKLTRRAAAKESAR